MKVSQVISEVFKKSDENMSESAFETDKQLKITCSIVLSAGSLLLTFFNISKHYTFMTFTTLVLTIGFAVSAYLFTKLETRKIGIYVVAFLICFTFTIYAITGENDGFAILWIALVPPIGMMLIGLRACTAVCIYFQIFLIVLFWTPLKSMVAEHYSPTFMMRFPALFMVAFAASFFLNVQKEHYYLKTEKIANYDVLTNLHNRRHYEDTKKAIVKDKAFDGISIISIDVNGLKNTNDNLGHEAGDELIAGAASYFSKAFEGAKEIARVGGDEFAVITYMDKDTINEQIDNLNKMAATFKGKYVSGISLSIGVSHMDDHPDFSFDELEKDADHMMYRSKSEYYKNCGIDRRRR